MSSIDSNKRPALHLQNQETNLNSREALAIHRVHLKSDIPHFNLKKLKEDFFNPPERNKSYIPFKINYATKNKYKLI